MHALIAFLMMLFSSFTVNSRIVMLKSYSGSSCTGFQVTAPSGTDYLMSAGHCGELAHDGSISVVTESGLQIERRIVECSKTVDLCLIEGLPHTKGLHMGQSIHPHDHVTVVGHGLGLPLWDVAGYVIGDVDLGAMGGGSDIPWTETLISAAVQPGHSGSPVFDDHNNVVGVVSIGTSMGIGGMVRLSDIQAFLGGY